MSEHFFFIQTKLNRYVRKLLLAALVLISISDVLLFMPLPAYAAADPSSAQLNRPLGLRVKVEHETEAGQGNTGQNERAAGDLADLLSDEWLDIDTEKWEKSGDYYYYRTPLRSGESAVFMESVTIPPFIDETFAGITFHIRIIAEVFPFMTDVAKTSLQEHKEHISVTMQELEYAQSELRDFTNNQTVVPGQRVSKIVKIYVYDQREPVVDQTDKSTNPSNGNPTMKESTQNIPENPTIRPSTDSTPAPAANVAAGKTTDIQDPGMTVKGAVRTFLTGDNSAMLMWLCIAMASMLLMMIYMAGLHTADPAQVAASVSKKDHFSTSAVITPLVPEGTMAYLTDRDQKTNQLSLGEVRTTITEQFDPPELKTGTNVFRKSVRILNTGTAPCYVRVFLSVSDSDIAQKTWFAASEEEAAADRFVLSTEYMANLPPGWLFNEIDHYCYYTRILQPGEETTPLIYAVKTVFADEEEVRPYEIIVYQEAVQAIYEKTAGNAGTPEYEAAWRANMHHENE